MKSSSRALNPMHSWARLDGVDLLRGLAILFVLMNHVNMRLLFAHVPYTRGLPRQLVSSLVWNGQRGVQIFFAISGFLITSTAQRRWGSLTCVSLRDFYLLRFARIGPLLLALLAVLSILHLAHFQGFVVPAKTGGLPRALLAALTFHVNVLEARRGYLPGNWDIPWSLSVEEMFYLFFPGLCRLLDRGKLFIALLLGFIVLGPFGRTLLAHGDPVWQEYSYLGGMDAIAMGCLTAVLLCQRRLSQRATRTCACFAILLLLLTLAFSSLVDRWLGESGLDMTLLTAGACLAIAAFSQNNWRAPIFLKPVVFLGQRSYEVYLTHMFVVLAAFAIFVRAGSPLRAVPILFAAVLVIAALVGEGVARFYSEPLNRLLRQYWGVSPSLTGSVMDAGNILPVPKETQTVR